MAILRALLTRRVDQAQLSAGQRALLFRLLRVPVRHLASVTVEHDHYLPTCICGWVGDIAAHPGKAFGEAHLHTRYVDTRLQAVEEQDEQPVIAEIDPDRHGVNEPWQLVLGQDEQTLHAVPDVRAVRRSW